MRPQPAKMANSPRVDVYGREARRWPQRFRLQEEVPSTRAEVCHDRWADIAGGGYKFSCQRSGGIVGIHLNTSPGGGRRPFDGGSITLVAQGQPQNRVGGLAWGW